MIGQYFNIYIVLIKSVRSDGMEFKKRLRTSHLEELKSSSEALRTTYRPKSTQIVHSEMKHFFRTLVLHRQHSTYSYITKTTTQS